MSLDFFFFLIDWGGEGTGVEGRTIEEEENRLTK